jgi:hypothetical protein
VRCFLANLNRFPWQIVAQSLSGTKREAYYQTFFTRKVLANLKGIFVKNKGKPEIEKSRELTYFSNEVGIYFPKFEIMFDQKFWFAVKNLLTNMTKMSDIYL